MTVRINLWSGPRNVSTALMYSFAQRSDTAVVDEPLYGHYLRADGSESSRCRRGDGKHDNRRASSGGRRDLWGLASDQFYF